MDCLGKFLGVGNVKHGEGNGNPLQYSCLENPMDGGAWWAAVHGVAQSRTRLKQLSSSSSSNVKHTLPKHILYLSCSGDNLARMMASRKVSIS